MTPEEVLELLRKVVQRASQIWPFIESDPEARLLHALGDELREEKERVKSVEHKDAGTKSLCDCDCGHACPLGKSGMTERCSAEELRHELFRRQNYAAEHDCIENGFELYGTSTRWNVVTDSAETSGWYFKHPDGRVRVLREIKKGELP